MEGGARGRLHVAGGGLAESKKQQVAMIEATSSNDVVVFRRVAVEALSKGTR